MIPRDPLAGQRQAINDEDQHALMWPDVGQGCPVEVGQIFKLRNCHIEITRVHRVQPKGKPWSWRAEFMRIHPHREMYLLDRKGGYTDDPDAAMRAQEDLEHAATIDPIKEEDRSEEHRNCGEPPEPEAFPPHEVESTTANLESRQRYEREQVEARVAHDALPLWERLRRLEGVDDVDLQRQLSRIKQGVEAAESKRRRLSRMPSDRAA